MAYMSTEKARNIRNALKKEFPEIKFSVRKEHSIALHVTLVKSPYFEDELHEGVNHYYIDDNYEDQPEARDVLKKIDETIRTVGEYYDKSDSMTDYFDTAFYYEIEIGTWDKPHVKV